MPGDVFFKGGDCPVDPEEYRVDDGTPHNPMEQRDGDYNRRHKQAMVEPFSYAAVVTPSNSPYQGKRP